MNFFSPSRKNKVFNIKMLKELKTNQQDGLNTYMDKTSDYIKITTRYSVIQKVKTYYYVILQIIITNCNMF